VLFPGLVLPLHVFEERYRLLLRHLLDRPADQPRRFGVVAIELGHEVGAGAARRLAGTGCTADVHGITQHADGRFDVVATGGSRFHIENVDDRLAYPRAEVTPLPDEVGPVTGQAVEIATRLFRAYCGRLNTVIEASAQQAAPGDAEMPGVSLPRELPNDPLPLSYLIAASMMLGRGDKQRLLEAEHAAARLEAECLLLRRETRLLRGLRSIPADNLLDTGSTLN